MNAQAGNHLNSRELEPEGLMRLIRIFVRSCGKLFYDASRMASL